MRRYLWIYILISVLVLIWGVRALTQERLVTQTVQSVEYEKKITADGYIVRDEVVYNAQSAGMAESVYLNEERVSKGKKIATIYTDGIDAQTKQALDTVNAKIRRLEKKSSAPGTLNVDLVSAEEKIGSLVSSVVEMTQTGNFDELDLLQTEIAGYVHVSEGESVVNPTKEALADLYAQKNTLEASVRSAKQDVYSTIAGVFVFETDGYEVTLTPDAVKSMSVSDFEAINIEREAYVPETLSAGDRVCKVVDNTRWCFATVIRPEFIDDTEEGDKVWLRFPETSSERIDARVEYISPIDSGKAVVVISCNAYTEGVFSKRKVECEIVTRVYDGFQIPQAAVRVDEDGETGVFVSSSGIIQFRKIHILYRTDNTVIAAKSDKPGYLKQYDAVIIGGKNITSGAIVE